MALAQHAQRRQAVHVGQVVVQQHQVKIGVRICVSKARAQVGASSTSTASSRPFRTWRRPSRTKVTIASPYCIWVLKQASDKLPWELDEAARMDGATAIQLFRLVYLPLMVPSLVAVGTYALLLAWNEYLYAFLLLSKDTSVTLAVALGNFLSADDSPWELLMATGLIYALPPAAIYYVFKRYMVSGLTAGAVKS